MFVSKLKTEPAKRNQNYGELVHFNQTKFAIAVNPDAVMWLRRRTIVNILWNNPSAIICIPTSGHYFPMEHW